MSVDITGFTKTGEALFLGKWKHYRNIKENEKNGEDTIY